MGRLIGSGILGLALLMLGPTASQAAILDANCPGLPTSGESPTGRVAQTFTAVRTGQLVGGQMWVDKAAGSDFQLQILNADANGPIEGVLGSATVPDSAIPTDPDGPAPTHPAVPVNGTFNPQVSVVAGHSYAIVLTRLGPEDWLIKDRSEANCPGNEFKSGAPGSGWALEVGDFDLPFQTTVEPANQVTVKSQVGRTLTVTVPNDGTVSVVGVPVKIAKKASTAKRKRRSLIATSQVAAPGAGDVTVPLRLSKAGKARLRQKGKVRSAITVTFTPTGGQPASTATTIKLKRK